MSQTVEMKAIQDGEEEGEGQLPLPLFGGPGG